MFTEANMIVLKVTRDCNFRCKYCYLVDKDQHRGERIKLDVFKRIIDRAIEDKKKSNNKKKLNIVLHGGEPLLLNNNTLSSMLRYMADAFVQNNIDFGIGLQTNMSLLNEEKAIILSDYNVNVGVSFDGIKTSNLMRTTISNDIFEKKFELLQKYNINFGVLIVVTKQNLPYAYKSAKYITKKYDIPSVKVNYAEDVTSVGDIEVNGKDFFEQALKPFIDDYIKTGISIEANMFRIINIFLAHTLTYCHPSKTNCGGVICGAGSQILATDPTGNVYFCGRYSRDYEDAYIGNIFEKDFADLHRFKRHLDFALKKHKIVMKHNCDICPARYICDHGCMAFHFSKFEEWGIRTDLVCPIYKSLHSYMIQNKEKIFKAFINNHMKNGNKFNYNLNSRIIKIKPEYQYFKIGDKQYIISVKNSHTITVEEK